MSSVRETTTTTTTTTTPLPGGFHPFSWWWAFYPRGTLTHLPAYPHDVQMFDIRWTLYLIRLVLWRGTAGEELAYMDIVRIFCFQMHPQRVQNICTFDRGMELVGVRGIASRRSAYAHVVHSFNYAVRFWVARMLCGRAKLWGVGIQASWGRN